VPLKRRSGEYFGTLCALDSKPASLSEQKFEIFYLLADLIAWQLEAEERHARSEAALLDAQETALLRERFIGILGHDLRSPLSAVLVNAHLLLRREDLPTGYSTTIQRIATSTQRVMRMVSDLLDFARGHLGGGMPIRPQLLEDVHVLVQDVIAELEPTFPTRSVELARAPGPVTAEWDQDRMAQALSNLIGNALEHSPGDAAVRVRIDASPETVVLEIRNEGAPIPKDVLTRLFDPFRRGAETPLGSTSGLGLGLYIAKQIVDAHRGALEVCSTPEHGTSVTATLPRRMPLRELLNQ
jgi:sigma-B regulation protein RsbU (phosphoserine phosphatase)